MFFSAPVTPRTSHPTSRCGSPTSTHLSDYERYPIIADSLTGLPAPSARTPKLSRSSRSSPAFTVDMLNKAARMVTMTKQLRAVEQARAVDALPTAALTELARTFSWTPTDNSSGALPPVVPAIMQGLVDCKLWNRCTPEAPRHASDDELQLVHTAEYVRHYGSLSTPAPQATINGFAGDDRVYISSNYSETAASTRCAAAAVIDATRLVAEGRAKNAVVLAQPAGRLVGQSGPPRGLGVFNNIAIAARHALQTQTAQRIAILDWGRERAAPLTQLFASDPRVVVASIFRHDRRGVADATAATTYTGLTNNIVNVPLPQDVRVSDADYLAAFRSAVVPILSERCPSAGYAHLTQSLMGVSHGRIVLVLEDTPPTTLSESIAGLEGCLHALLGDDLSALPYPDVSPNEATVAVLEQLWMVHRRAYGTLETTAAYRHFSPQEYMTMQRQREDEELDATVALASLSMMAVPEMPSEEAEEEARAASSDVTSGSDGQYMV
ncbi:uncharacterized protein MONBRDRAFT_30655 [Monosiga brevicollis MX1]|uniref:histone deacetylase n=1 Tax=Monosiga brevicollis TaxID=81824 RepID=A9VEK7_MONBE|nr:uncharacterized protein MONBRDRAFT_30655 [Monosiga brevicollis MX1]EDQ84034.1 predicted protein [Monosiga brevicollis MX1]|eukprot:XP_001751154.1 hypothetical protein [Monosiga brevicollis MX1]